MTQTVQIITLAQLQVVTNTVFAKGEPHVREAYSDYSKPTKTLTSAIELNAYLESHLIADRGFANLAIYYSDMRGYVREKRIELAPGAVKGHTHRFCLEGWGLIQLQVKRLHPDVCECRIAANSEARACRWENTYEELKSPDLWDWSAVNRHAGRLARLLRRLGKEQRASSSTPAEP